MKLIQLLLKKRILNKKNTDVTVEMIQNSISELERQKNIINDKELLNINQNLIINIETTIELFNTKKEMFLEDPLMDFIIIIIVIIFYFLMEL